MNKGKLTKIIVHALFAVLLITTIVLLLIECSSEYSKAAKSDDALSRLGPAMVAAIAGIVIVSEVSLWISAARIIRNVQSKKWFWTAYDSVTALLSFATGYAMILHCIGKISNQTSDIVLYALGGAIVLQVVGFIARAGNDLKNE